jgi:hypothetical protein
MRVIRTLQLSDARILSSLRAWRPVDRSNPWSHRLPQMYKKLLWEAQPFQIRFRFDRDFVRSVHKYDPHFRVLASHVSLADKLPPMTSGTIYRNCNGNSTLERLSGTPTGTCTKRIYLLTSDPSEHYYCVSAVLVLNFRIHQKEVSA